MTPGLYTNTGFHLAREGTLVYTDPLVESIPENDWPLFYRVDKPVPEWRHLRFKASPSSHRSPRESSRKDCICTRCGSESLRPCSK